MIKTNKIAFVGDLHLDSTTPSSRVDSYSDASIDKLYSLKSVALVKDIKVIILLGDVFNKHDQSNVYMNKIFKVFDDFKKENIIVKTIVGNHDLSFERMDTIDRSPLQMLLTAGLIDKLDVEVLETPTYSVRVVGLDYPDNPVPVKELVSMDVVYNILCAHRFYNYAFNDGHNLSSDDCLELGYNVYAMGHDHIQYDVEKNNSFWVLRPGSFMRTSSHKYNLDRNIAIDVLEFAGTEQEPQVIYSREVIRSKPASEVFSSSVYQREETRSIENELEVLHNRVGEMLVKMETSHNEKDVYKVLDEICSDPEVKLCVESYLAVNGYVRVS